MNDMTFRSASDVAGDCGGSLGDATTASLDRGFSIGDKTGGRYAVINPNGDTLAGNGQLPYGDEGSGFAGRPEGFER
jgi:hypothetical protein